MATETQALRPAVDEKETFTLSDQEFATIRSLVRKLTGISLSDAKRDLVYSRFSKRVRALGLKSFAEYCRLVDAGEIDEFEEFSNAITTNLTAFFREGHHFEYLTTRILPEIKSRNLPRVRIWSAGCSTGEEPYSIAMTVQENWPNPAGVDLKILATDLDSSVLVSARAGIYDKRRVEGMPERRVRRWFSPVEGDPERTAIRVNKNLRQMVHFRQLNLMDAWPMHGSFELIFCRNTVIYFDKDTQRVLFDRFADIQNPGDYLVIGHSETLYSVCERYKLVGQTVYQKIR